MTSQDSAGDKNIKQQGYESKRFQEAWSVDEITDGVDAKTNCATKECVLLRYLVPLLRELKMHMLRVNE